MYHIEREGKSETRKVGLDAPAVTRTRRVVPTAVIHTSGSCKSKQLPLPPQPDTLGAAALVCVYVWRQRRRCGITQLKKNVLHRAGRSNTVSLLFCEYIEPIKYQTHGCWGRQVFLSRARLPKMQPIP